MEVSVVNVKPVPSGIEPAGSVGSLRNLRVFTDRKQGYLSTSLRFKHTMTLSNMHFNKFGDFGTTIISLDVSPEVCS